MNIIVLLQNDYSSMLHEKVNTKDILETPTKGNVNPSLEDDFQVDFSDANLRSAAQSILDTSLDCNIDNWLKKITFA